MSTDNTSDEFFWPSYVDLMTSLFIIALVLFVVSHVSLSVEKNRIEADVKIKKKVDEINQLIKELPQRNFKYEENYKRFELIIKPQFEKESWTIKDEYKLSLIGAGKEIEELVTRIKHKSDSLNLNARYLIVIEGMASMDGQENANYYFSYQRALALYQLWQNEKIIFDPKFCEVLIAGSGIRGIGRASNDLENRRFLIQIIPKVNLDNLAS